MGPAVTRWRRARRSRGEDWRPCERHEPVTGGNPCSVMMGHPVIGTVAVQQRREANPSLAGRAGRVIMDGAQGPALRRELARSDGEGSSWHGRHLRLIGATVGGQGDRPGRGHAWTRAPVRVPRGTAVTAAERTRWPPPNGSGANGLHAVVPPQPESNWEQSTPLDAKRSRACWTLPGRRLARVSGRAAGRPSGFDWSTARDSRFPR